MSGVSVSSVNGARKSRPWISHWPRSQFRRGLFVAIYLVFLVAVVWGVCWAYYSWKTGSPVSSSMDVWQLFYPELKATGVENADVRADDQLIDVLMLGGSTIDSAFGDIEARLKLGLQAEFGNRIRIYNLARSAHTSRDSYLKYSKLKEKPFDLILVYDGFNDCRMNNCRREMFRDDYTHCVWYRGFEKRRRTGTVTLPAEMALDLGRAIGLQAPESNQDQFGGDLKTPQPFRKNVEAILQGAIAQRSVVVLQSFAFHIPPEYTDQKFRRGELDYGQHTGSAFPLQMWGRPANIVNCMAAHNAVIRELAHQYRNDTVFVDQDRLMSQIGSNFVDGCHFTREGCRQFVDNLLPVVLRRLRAKFATHVTPTASP